MKECYCLRLKMGSSESRLADLSSNEFIQKFVGKEIIAPNDPFWEQFLTFTFIPPKSAADQRNLDESVQGICRQLLANNPRSGNFHSLVSFFIEKSICVRANDSQNDNFTFSWSTHNSLFVLKVLCKFFVENITEEDFANQFEIGGDKKSAAVEGSDQLSKLDVFLSSLVELLVDLPVRDTTYALHFEAINCLLVLLSAQLFTNQQANKSMIYRYLIAGKSSIHSCLLIKRLLSHFGTREKAPPNFMGRGDTGGSIVLGLASGIWNMLTFGLANNEPLKEGEPDSPLANQSLLLILVLVSHCTCEKNLLNPYREALFSFSNSAESGSAVSASSASFTIDFPWMYLALCNAPASDQSTLLLYLLIHCNPNMRSFIISRADIELLVVPILKTLYHAPHSNSHHIYMSLIILLILSEDEIFNRTVHQIKLRSITWYTERAISEISLGGLLVLVVIRTIQYNILKMRDKYLHTNCLAALANMSSQFSDLHPYVSQRLVSLFETLAKKHNRLSSEVAALKRSQSTVPSEQESDMEQDLAVLEDVLRMVLEILNSCLTHQLASNPNLIYTLLYKKETFEMFKSHPAFQDVVCNIDLVITYFAYKLQQIQSDLGEGDVLETIQQGAMQWNKDRLKKFPDLKFKYVEEDRPEEFFIPYVWSLVCQSSGIHWNMDKVKLFFPDTSEAVC
ncbi:Hypothetical predicted protein [Cloeon dipterum]|uniref:Dymeclin n=1 Tax=Cloeon dipterum TaxID=197152 RepID=A0A8S1C549_9INSE|nr:Hypothetical predicted protein [Cloeon dipterum]